MPPHIITAIPVPFSANSDIDLAAFEGALRAIDPYVDGVLVAGTTGEFVALDDDERVELFRRAAEVMGADRVIAHLGHGSTRQVLRLADATAVTGVRRFALLTPYFLPSDDDGVVEYFRALTAAHPEAEVYPYVFPERSGLEVTTGLLRRIMRLPGVVGVKLSGGAAAQLATLAPSVGEGQVVYSGDDSDLGHVLNHGGNGVVSGVSAAFPKLFRDLATALDAGDERAAAELQAVAAKVVALAGPTITRLKVAMTARDGADWACRMSLPAVDDPTRREIQEAVQRYS